MKLNNILTIILLVFLVFNCESPLSTKNESARINLFIDFPEQMVNKGTISKTNNIATITIIVDASDMDRISEDFPVNNSRVECNLDVPMGDDRLFKIEGKDGAGNLQFNGETRVDIQNSEETITINNLNIIAPNPVNITFSDITEESFVINWDKCNAEDFSHYRVLVSTDPVLDINTDKVGNDVFDKNSLSMTITGADAGTVYYAAVIAFDTENYFNGVLEFGVNNSIVKKVETADVADIPEPVDVQVDYVTSSSFYLFWDKSTASNFNFYRILLGQTSSLNADNDKYANDINDINQTNFLVDGLTENTVYYTAVLTVSDNMEFLGSLDYGAAYSIVHKVTTADMVTLSYDDAGFENLIYSTTTGVRFVNIFTQPAPNTYIREVWLYLNDTSNEDYNYRIVIIDENGNDIFYSNALATTYGEGWVGWQIPWENVADGFVTGEFAIGIETAKDIGWPEIGVDQTSDYGASYYVDTDGTWYSTNEIGYSGNLGIQVVVDISGEAGATKNRCSKLTLTPVNSDNMIIGTGKPGMNLQMITGQDVKKLSSGKKGEVRTR